MSMVGNGLFQKKVILFALKTKKGEGTWLCAFFSGSQTLSFHQPSALCKLVIKDPHCSEAFKNLSAGFWKCTRQRWVWFSFEKEGPIVGARYHQPKRFQDHSRGSRNVLANKALVQPEFLRGVDLAMSHIKAVHYSDQDVWRKYQLQTSCAWISQTSRHQQIRRLSGFYQNIRVVNLTLSFICREGDLTSRSTRSMRAHSVKTSVTPNIIARELMHTSVSNTLDQTRYTKRKHSDFLRAGHILHSHLHSALGKFSC